MSDPKWARAFDLSKDVQVEVTGPYPGKGFRLLSDKGEEYVETVDDVLARLLERTRT